MGRSSLQGTPWHIEKSFVKQGTGKSIPMCIYIVRRKCVNPESEFYGVHCDINKCKKATKTPKGTESIRDIKLNKASNLKKTNDYLSGCKTIKTTEQCSKNKATTEKERDKKITNRKNDTSCKVHKSETAKNNYGMIKFK